MTSSMFQIQTPASSPAALSRSERHSSTDIPSDDDSYAGVEQISDSEDDDPRVEKAEERAIIYSADREETHDSLQFGRDDTWQGFSDYPNFLDDIPLFGEDVSIEDEWPTHAQPTQTPKRDAELDDLPVFRRTNSIDLESSEDEIEMFDDVFPDIFVDKDKLDSSFRRQIDPDDVSDDGSYWEQEGIEAMYGDSDRNEISTETMDEDQEYDSDITSSDEESDMSGETTDEDLPDEFYTQTRRSLARSSENDSEAEAEADASPSSLVSTPRLYSWKHTSHKPFATISSNCKKMILFNVKQDTRDSYTDSNPNRLPLQQTSLTSSPTIDGNFSNMMMAAFPNPSPAMLPPFLYSSTQESLFPTSNGFLDYVSFFSSSDHDTDVDEELYADATITNLDEFINFESDDSTASDDNETKVTSNPDEGERATTDDSKKKKCEDRVHPLIPHFNRGIVGSWRQKQNTHRLLHRNIATPESLAFGGNQFMEGTLKGVKTGRLKHASTPITPVRKSRLLNPLRIKTSGLTSSMKRKLDGYDDGRDFAKRSRTRI